MFSMLSVDELSVYKYFYECLTFTVIKIGFSWSLAHEDQVQG